MLDGYFYSIRILVCHPVMSAADLASGMGEEAKYSGEPRSNGKPSFWSRVTETRGERGFFSGVAGAISWLEGRRVFVQAVLATGGKIEVIVNLPGDRNIGDSWKMENMARAAALGVTLGVEVFPNIRGVTSDT